MALSVYEQWVNRDSEQRDVAYLDGGAGSSH